MGDELASGGVVRGDAAWIGEDPPPFVIPQPVLKVANYVQFSAEAFDGFVSNPLDRLWNPWKYPDRPRWPEFVLLPRLERAKATALMVRSRLRNAVAALRGEWPDAPIPKEMLL